LLQGSKDCATGETIDIAKLFSSNLGGNKTALRVEAASGEILGRLIFPKYGN